ncbi:MAG: beta-galactosidase [Muribaculaceae bacterium]|nr:beta-galactosidase [Muribaculaceae bacterium]
MKNNLLIGAIIFLSVFAASAQKYISGSNLPYHNPTPGEITIMAVSPLPDGLQPSPQAFQELVDCGFNLTTSQGSVAYFNNIFNMLGDMNLKFLISNPNFITKDVRQSYISAFKDNPHLGGWLLKDEPLFRTWPELSQQYKLFFQEDTNKFIYVNLFGNISNNIPGVKNMSEYAEIFQKMFTPACFSYDFYPIITRNKKTSVEYDQFYSDLEDFSSVSQKNNRPFWTFCESIAYTTEGYSRPTPTEAYFRFQAYNALAYGAQGIVYWSYGMRKSSGGENFQSALVDLKGKRSKAWYAAQKVNNQIKKFNNVFLECDVKEVRHTGDKIYKGTHKLSGSIGPFSMVRTGAAGVVVSRIENNGEKYIVIVNRDVTKKQKITLELLANKKVIDLTSNNQQQYSGITDFNVTLDKSDWAIFKEI